jgi:hypothetical protein
VATGATGIEDAFGSRQIDFWGRRALGIGLREKHQKRQKRQHAIGIVLHFV